MEGIVQQPWFSKAILILLVFYTSTSTCLASRILVYPYGHCMNSHLLNSERLAKILVEDGHQVSMLVSHQYEEYAHHQQLKDSSIDDSTETKHPIELLKFDAPKDFKPVCDYDTIDFMLNAPLKERFDLFVGTSVKYCEEILKNSAFMHYIKRQNFDLFVMESLDPCSKILADYLDVPFIPLMTAGVGHWDGNPRNPSYIPAAIGPFLPKMNFGQRLGNFIFKFMYESIPTMLGFNTPFEDLKQKYNINTSLDIADTFDRAAVKFVNSDFAIDYPAPVEPDTILVGGFAINEPKPLNTKFQDFMDSIGEEGLIILSFGTLVKRYDAKWTKLFADAFAKLPQKVLWRYSESTDPSVLDFPMPDNVHRVKWLPQTDLLANNKTKLFITHCGLNSATEAAYFGVPIVGVPMSGDHFHHASKLTDYAGMGEQVDIFSLTSEKLYEAITRVIEDPKYKQNALKVSERVQDQPISPVDKIKFWVDYVIKYQGAPHLKSEAHKLKWYQYLCLDVILCLSFIICTILFFALFISYFVLKYSSRILSKYIKNCLESKSKLS